MHLQLGVCQGGPLSPALFAMARLVLVPMLYRLSPHIKVLFYADDLLLYIPLPPAFVCKLLKCILEVLEVYDST